MDNNTHINPGLTPELQEDDKGIAYNPYWVEFAYAQENNATSDMSYTISHANNHEPGSNAYCYAFGEFCL